LPRKKRNAAGQTGLRAGDESFSEFLDKVLFCCDKQRLDMTKTEIQVALAAATETTKKTAGVFLETHCALAYKETK
jgi:hypothetical protein